MLLRTYQSTRRLTLEKVLLIYNLSAKCDNLIPLYYKYFCILILNFLENEQASIVTRVVKIVPGNEFALGIFVNLSLLSMTVVTNISALHISEVRIY
jgi:hypothetical protein